MERENNTVMTGLLGYPVSHSLSPLMHNYAFRHLGLAYHYAAFAVPPHLLPSAVEGIRALGFRGCNLTIPHKVAVIPLLDELDEEARLIGAVNTIVNEKGALIGYNTDGKGYLRSLTEETGILLSGGKAVILGAGGAARAIAVTLARSGLKEIVIANRTRDKAEELASTVFAAALKPAVPAVRVVSLEQAAEKVADAGLLVNTTSIGMTPHTEDCPLPTEVLHAELVVSDLVYAPLETALLRAAKKAGARTHPGVGMLVHQGALAFQYWTGREAPLKLMYETVWNELKSK